MQISLDNVSLDLTHNITGSQNSCSISIIFGRKIYNSGPRTALLALGQKEWQPIGIEWTQRWYRTCAHAERAKPAVKRLTRYAREDYQAAKARTDFIQSQK